MLIGSCRTAATIKLDENEHNPTYCRCKTLSKTNLCWYSTIKYGRGSSDSLNSWGVSYRASVVRCRC